jgi:hypothetical protein
MTNDGDENPHEFRTTTLLRIAPLLIVLTRRGGEDQLRSPAVDLPVGERAENALQGLVDDL